MTAHALLSASGAERWINCPPSARLQEQFPDTTSEYAQEGTLAHELGELKLLRAFNHIGDSEFSTRKAGISTHELYSREMEQHTDEYLDFISRESLSYKYKPAVMIEKRVNYSSFAPEGFGTADCLIVGGGTLTVIDFKYGKGVKVDAEHNPQMMLYGLGALAEYSILFDVQKVKLCVVQPRLNNFSEWEIAADELMHWGNHVIRPAAELAFKGEGKASAGKHCRFCKAKAVCRARAENNMSLSSFAPVKPEQLKEVLSNEEIGELIEKAEDLERWAGDLKEWALSSCLNGEDIPGWKAVEGRSSRRFNDPDSAFRKLISSGIDEAMLYERKPLSLAALEKVVGKKDFSAILAEDIVKSAGKPTLAKESDKREKITNKVSAAQDFAL